MDWTLIGVTAFGTFTGIVGWLISRQLDSVKEAIKLLFIKKDALEKELNDFKIHVAGNHYEARTIDVKFEKLENTFRDGFRDLGNKLEKLTDAMMNHISDDRTGSFKAFKGDQ